MVRSRRRAFSSKICARRGFKKKTGNSAQGACSPRYAIIRSAFSTVARTLSQSMVGLINQVRQRTQGAVQRLVAHIPKIDWLRNREDVDANPIKSWDGLGQIKLIPKPRVPSGLLLLPFDVMGPGILSFLAPLDMGAFRQSSHAGQRAVDMYAEIRTHHMILGNQARRIIIGNILTTRQEYVPDGSNYSPYLLYRFIQIFGDLMTAKEWPVDPGYMQRLQCRESLGDTDFLEESTRTCLADWLLEVASEYAYPYSVWHDAVLRLDTYLSKRPTRRLKLQLIGCACLLIETNRVGIQGLTVGDAFNLCDDKYSIEEIGQAVTMVAVDTETELSIGTTPILPSILDCAMCYFLCTSRITSPYVHMTVRHSCSHDVGDNGDEHHIIVVMLADLAAMDCDFLKFSPFTTAAAIAYYASLVMHFYSQSNIFVSSASGSKFGAPRRPYVVPRKAYLGNPFGSKLLQNYVSSTPVQERQAINYCVVRLWKMHSDFLWHTFFCGDELNRYRGVFIVGYHVNIFKGILKKFLNIHSCRHHVWKTAGRLPEDMVLCAQLRDYHTDCDFRIHDVKVD